MYYAWERERKLVPRFWLQNLIERDYSEDWKQMEE
jgi:hypothetical protein